MKTIIIATDFSTTADNAAIYGVQLAQHFKAEKVILYHSFDLSPVGNELLMFEAHPEEMYASSINALKKLQTRLRESIEIPVEFEFELHADNTPFTIGLEYLCEKHPKALVIAGEAERTPSRHIWEGNNAVSLAESLKNPIIIIPEHTKFTPIKTIVLACDLKDIEKTIPLEEVTYWIEHFGAKVLLVNITKKGKNLPSNKEQEKEKLMALFAAFDPEYHSIVSDDIAIAIDDFAVEHQAELIINLPKTYNFFQSLLHSSVSDRLIRYAKLPVLLLRST